MLAERSRTATLERREVLYLSADAASSIFVVCSGRIRVSKVTRDGKALTLGYAGTYDAFGLGSFCGGPREELAEARERSEVIEIPVGALNQAIRDHGEIGIALIRALAKQTRTLEGRLESLLFKDVSAKLAGALLDLTSNAGADEPDDDEAELVPRITHQELASLIGATRETVSQTIAQFRRQNLIDVRGRRLLITDRKSLRALR